MSCRICGRCSCTESFHKQEEIDEFDNLSTLNDRELIGICIDLKDENKDLQEQVDKLEEENEDLKEQIEVLKEELASLK